MIRTLQLEKGIILVILLFFFSTFAGTQLKAITLDTREADSTALVALNKATNGQNWAITKSNNKKWLVGPIDTWYGVKLNTTIGRVTTVGLASNNLAGSIPDSIGLLSRLQYIYLSNNKLSGPIPTAVNSISTLRSFQLYNNFFTFSNIAYSGITVYYSRFYYAPQYDLPAPTVTQNGNEITLTVEGNQHDANLYQWFADGPLLMGPIQYPTPSRLLNRQPLRWK